MKKYQYQLKDESLDFEHGVAILREHLPSRVFVGYPKITCSEKENEDLLHSLEKMGIGTADFRVDIKEYLSYVEEAQYKNKYPTYYDFNIHEKTFEHFVALKLLKLKEGDTFIDIAAEHSPHAEIFSRLTGCIGYMQDIMFKPGIHGHKIGGDASRLPIEDGFCQGVLAACSIEHFENESDILFMKEVSRILDNRGRVVVLPLYLHESPFCTTDPKYSIPGNVEFDDNVNIHCVDGYGNRHGRFYSPDTLFERLIRPNLEKMRFKVLYIVNFREIHESVYCRFALLGERV